jgi:hypothetical protein
MSQRNRPVSLPDAAGRRRRGHHDQDSMIRVKYGVISVVRTGETVTTVPSVSSICPLPRNSATL